MQETGRRLRAASVGALFLMSSCAMLPSEIDGTERWVVAVKSARLPSDEPWYSTFAEHSWVDVRLDGVWRRVEVLSRASRVRVVSIHAEEARTDTRFGGRQVHVIALYSGAKARRLGADILAVASRYPHADGYRAWPGPNSNTFVEWLSHEVSGLRLEQYPTALGKDYPGNHWVRAGVTTTRSGVELETPLLGVQVGVQEGLELHVLGLTIGVDLWPPQLKLPFLPGIPWGLAR